MPARLKKSKPQYERMKQDILQVLSAKPKMHNKLELIKKIINENLPLIGEEEIESDFERFMSEEKQAAFQQWIREQALDADKMQALVEDIFLHNGCLPGRL